VVGSVGVCSGAVMMWASAWEEEVVGSVGVCSGAVMMWASACADCLSPPGALAPSQTLNPPPYSFLLPPPPPPSPSHARWLLHSCCALPRPPLISFSSSLVPHPARLSISSLCCPSLPPPPLPTFSLPPAPCSNRLFYSLARLECALEGLTVNRCVNVDLVIGAHSSHLQFCFGD
jgi:hypothetical protein